jgi:hypothetical protein
VVPCAPPAAPILAENLGDEAGAWPQLTPLRRYGPGDGQAVHELELGVVTV